MSENGKLLAESMLKARFESRWRTISRSSAKHGVFLPNKETLWNKLLAKYRNDWRCSYCGQPLMIKDSTPPFGRSFSIEHKKSLYTKGDNSIDNLEIICHRCNIVKGTMEYDTYMALLKIGSQDLIDKMYAEIWAGRLADKLGREEAL